MVIRYLFNPFLTFFSFYSLLWSYNLIFRPYLLSGAALFFFCPHPKKNGTAMMYISN